MVNGKKNEHALKDAFMLGYFNAVISLSKLINSSIYFNNLHSGLFYLNASTPEKMPMLSLGPKLLLTTEIFGDIKGKSYLFLSDMEFELLTRNVPKGSDPGVDMKVEFIKELDNILSASVISQLSNTLGFKMYGDVPVLVGEVLSKASEIIHADFNEQTSRVYINAMFFSVENQPLIHPLFVWVMDGEVLGRHNTKTVL